MACASPDTYVAEVEVEERRRGAPPPPAPPWSPDAASGRGPKRGPTHQPPTAPLHAPDTPPAAPRRPDALAQVTQLGHVKDLARAFTLCCANPVAYGKIYNISGALRRKGG